MFILCNLTCLALVLAIRLLDRRKQNPPIAETLVEWHRRQMTWLERDPDEQDLGRLAAHAEAIAQMKTLGFYQETLSSPRETPR